jgi:hypothetical protein
MRQPKLCLARDSGPEKQREASFLLLARSNPGKSWVYFLESQEWVKVGHSTNMPKRISELRLANAVPVHLLGLMLGGKEQEKRYHKAMTDLGLNRRGEWFRTEWHHREAIKELCDGR